MAVFILEIVRQSSLRFSIMEKGTNPMAKRRLEYLLLLATVLFFHIILVNYLSFYLLLFFLALPVLSLAALLCSGRKVSVELNGTTGAVGRGEPIPFEMTVDNGGLISSGRRCRQAGDRQPVYPGLSGRDSLFARKQGTVGS